MERQSGHIEADAVRQNMTSMLLAKLHSIGDELAATGGELHDQADRFFGPVPTAAATAVENSKGHSCLLAQLDDAITRLSNMTARVRDGAGRLRDLG